MPRVKQFIAFIENLMGDDPALTGAQPDDGSIHIVACARASQLTGERDVAALRAFKDVLRGLALAEVTLETGALDYADFYADLRAAVEFCYVHDPDTGRDAGCLGVGWARVGFPGCGAFGTLGRRVSAN